jgi:hypothetical protein
VKRLLLAMLTAIVVAACSAGGSPGGGDGQTDRPAQTSGAGAAADLAAAMAAATKDACSVMPQDAVKQILPKAAAPQKEPEPFKCSMSDGTSVVEISIDAGALTSLETLNPCEPISGLGVSACYQEQVAADAYLQVLVTSSPTTILYVEVAGNDGKNHKDDARKVAQAILAILGA